MSENQASDAVKLYRLKADHSVTCWVKERPESLPNGPWVFVNRTAPLRGFEFSVPEEWLLMSWELAPPNGAARLWDAIRGAAAEFRRLRLRVYEKAAIDH